MNRILKLALMSISVVALHAGALAPARAADEQQKIIIATKHENPQKQGARFVLSNNRTLEEVKLALGFSQLPENVTAIIMEPGKSPRFSTASLEEIDQLFGGDGTHEIEFQDAKDPDKKPIDLDMKNARPIDDLFANLPGSAVQPQDGLWKAEMLSVDVTDCPAQVQNAVASGNKVTSQSKQLAFSNPFHPSDIAKDFGAFTWSQPSENLWNSNVLDVSGSGAKAKKSMQMAVRSATQIDFVSTFQMNLPAAAVAVLGAGTNCQSIVKARYSLLQ